VSNSDLYDVIVVGGGPAGSTMAWSLARRGVRWAVIERAIFPRERSAAISSNPQACESWRPMEFERHCRRSSPLPIHPPASHWFPASAFAAPSLTTKPSMGCRLMALSCRAIFSTTIFWSGPSGLGQSI